MSKKVAKIISVFNQKGGSGKTSIAINLAVYAGLVKKMKVLLVDIDDQATAQVWSSKVPEGEDFPADVRNLAAVVDKLKPSLKNEIENYDLIIIDCPPAINKSGPKTAMLLSDAVVIPTIPSPSDVWAVQAALELVKYVREMNEDLKPLILGSMVGRTNIARSSMEALSDSEDVFLLQSYTTNRAAYRESQLFGAGVINYSGASKEAKAEITSVCEEILSHV
jgi:chromosome partitioning protein